MNDIMHETVKEICDSMLNSPNRWKISTHTVKDTKSGIDYWLNSYSHAITEIWTGSTTERVFTSEQGHLIGQAFVQMSAHKASVSQQKIIDSYKQKLVSNNITKWWEFWK